MQKHGVLNESEKRDSLVKGAFSLTLSVIIVKIIGFLYKVPLSHIMGDEGMGYFNSAYTVFTFFYMLCSGGVPRAVSIVVTELDIKGNFKAARRVFLLSLKLFLTIGFSFTAALMLFSGFFASLIGSSLSAFSLFVIAPSLTFVSASGVIRGYLNGIGKMVPIAFAEVIEGSIKFIFGLLFAMVALRHGYDCYMISGFAVLGVTIGSFVGSLFLYICSKTKKTNEKTRQYTQFEINDKQIIKRIFKISLPITASSAIMGISNMIDLGMIIKRLVASGISEGAAVALYGNYTTLAIPMINLVSALISPLSAASLPHLTANCASGNKESFKKLTENIMTFTACVSVPMSFAYFFFSREILMLLFNDASASAAAPLLSLIAPSVIFMPLLTIMNTVLEASSFPKFSLFSMSIGAIIKLLLGYFLMGSLGISGAPLSTSISYAVSMIISFIFVSYVCKVKISVIKLMLPPILFSAASVGMSRVLYMRFCSEDVLFLFILFAVAAATVYVILLVVFMRKRLLSFLDFVKINKK